MQTSLSVERKEAEKTFEKMIVAHEGLLHRVCRIYAFTNADRQDLFQEIVLQLWQAFPRFKGEAKLSTWLYRVAINTAITGLRRKKDFITAYEPENLPQNMDENTSAAEEERLHQLYSAIAFLNEIERTLVMLYLDDRTYEEMEDILGISSSTLRVKMNRVKEKLRKRTKND